MQRLQGSRLGTTTAHEEMRSRRESALLARRRTTTEVDYEQTLERRCFLSMPA
jgi:hypothetical protein